MTEMGSGSGPSWEPLPGKPHAPPLAAWLLAKPDWQSELYSHNWISVCSYGIEV